MKKQPEKKRVFMSRCQDLSKVLCKEWLLNPKVYSWKMLNEELLFSLNSNAELWTLLSLKKFEVKKKNLVWKHFRKGFMEKESFLASKRRIDSFVCLKYLKSHMRFISHSSQDE
jgi:hypothetical protein